MLPHVFAFDAGVPTRFMPLPNQRGYVAHKRYAMMADLLGPGGTTVGEKVEKLIVATEQLLASWRSQGAIAESGNSREEFEQAMPELVKNAFDDPSRRSNPAHAIDD